MFFSIFLKKKNLIIVLYSTKIYTIPHFKNLHWVKLAISPIQIYTTIILGELKMEFKKISGCEVSDGMLFIVIFTNVRQSVHVILISITE